MAYAIPRLRLRSWLALHTRSFRWVRVLWYLHVSPEKNRFRVAWLLERLLDTELFAIM